MAFAVGTGAPLTGYPAQALWERDGTGYQQSAAVALDVDGSVAVPIMHTGGLFNLSVGATGANAGGTGGLPVGCVKATSGRIAKAQVTAAGNGSVALLIYDNVAGTATGTVIGVIKGAAAVGDQYVFDMPAMAGISIPAQANAPTVTLSWS